MPPHVLSRAQSAESLHSGSVPHGRTGVLAASLMAVTVGMGTAVQAESGQNLAAAEVRPDVSAAVHAQAHGEPSVDDRGDAASWQGPHTVRPTDLPLLGAVQEGWIQPPDTGAPATPDNPDPAQPDTRNRPQRLDFRPVPQSPELRSIIHNYVGRLDPLGCTATLIDGGAVTARHCGFRGDGFGAESFEASGNTIYGSDGRWYLVMNERPSVRTGRSQPQLAAANAGEISSVILPTGPNSDGTTIDTAILVAGSRVWGAVAAYRAMRLPPKQVEQLAQGTQLVMAGWPADQTPVMPTGEALLPRRQELSMAVLGVTNVTVGNGDTMRALLAAARRTGDGAVCSSGASGSEGWVRVDGRWQGAGELAWAIDLTGSSPQAVPPDEAAELRRKYGDEFGVDLTDVDALCGFGGGALALGINAVEYQIVSTRQEIPGYEGPASDAEAQSYYAARLADPAVAKLVVQDGQIAVDGKGADVGAQGIQYLNQPVIFMNTFTGQLFAAGYSREYPGRVMVIQYNTPGQLLVRPLADSPPSIRTVTGALVPQAPDTTRDTPGGGLVSSDGTARVGYVTAIPSTSHMYYTFQVDTKGAMQLSPLAGIG